MKAFITTIVMLAGLCWFSDTSLAQAPRSRFPGGRSGGFGGPGTRGSTGLQNAGLKKGSRLPKVTAFDENGEPLAIGKMKGSYTVLVFGCLT